MEELEEGERKKPGVAREYRTDEIAVYWEPEYCIHAAACLIGLPQVFDVGRRPWVAIDAASADEVARVVMRCPTGALSFKRVDGGEQEPAPEETSVQPRTNGPLFVRGRVKVVGMQGNVLREATRAAFCRCGQSSNKPFCDGTHRAIGFQAK